IEFPYFEYFTQRKMEMKKYIPGEALPVEKPLLSHRQQTGLWLQFFPQYVDDVADQVHAFKIFLVNETVLAYQVSYRLTKQGKCDFELAQELRPFSHLYVHDLLFEDLNDKPVFHFLIRLAHPDLTKQPSWERHIRMKAKQIHERLEEIKQDGQASFSELLFEKYPEARSEKSSEVNASKHDKRAHIDQGKKGLPEYEFEIDLHVDKLHVDTRGMTQGDILAYQLKVFTDHLERAVAIRQPHLKVIHGIGKGVLRERIHEILRQTPEVSRVDNDINPGATLIYFSYLG
ncbi:MAG: Smr/MutS family protein, partial [Thermoflavifilum sp.]|nr:Smr/MutS family protein [Thermoflavifilum sp.]